MTAAPIISELRLQPHPEGGWYREVYRSPTRIETSRGPRSALTTIYYLLEQNQLSRWHVVQADELWHYYGGAALELFSFHPATRKLVRHLLGPIGSVGTAADVGGAADVGSADGVGGAAAGAGAAPVAVIPAGVWQAARSLGPYTLVGCSVGPGFDFADFQLVCDVPAHADHFRGELAPLADLL